MKKSRLVLFGLFAASCALNWQSIHDAPFWDAAMGLHPGAVWIAQHGLPDLMGQPGYALGGPNTHSLSLGTLFAATCYRLFDAPLPVMHVATFAIAAVGFSGLYLLLLPHLGEGPSMLLAAAVAIFPAVWAQAGSLYVEIPLMACAVWVMLAWQSGRHWSSVLLAVVAFWLKETGAVVVGALILATSLEGGSWRRRLALVAATLLPVMAIFAVQRYFAPHGSEFIRPTMGDYLTRNLFGRFPAAPDVYLLTGAGLLAATTTWTKTKLPALILSSFVGFFAVSGFVFPTYLLPRYFVMAIPAAVMAIALSLHRFAGRTGAVAFAAGLTLYSMANHNGDLFPANPTNDGSIAERSLEYRELLAIHKDCAKAILAVEGGPVFYGYPEHFLVGYPSMGYVAAVPPNGLLVSAQVQNLRTVLQRHPDRAPTFRFIYDYAEKGGDQIRTLLALAKEYGWRVEEAQRFEHGRYKATMVAVSP